MMMLQYMLFIFIISTYSSTIYYLKDCKYIYYIPHKSHASNILYTVHVYNNTCIYLVMYYDVRIGHLCYVYMYTSFKKYLEVILIILYLILHHASFHVVSFNVMYYISFPLHIFVIQ